MIECGSTFLSIAFGAPLFLDEEARDYFSEKGKVPMASRLMTYINEDDPVPLMLNGLIAHPSTSTVPLMLNELMGPPSMADLQELREQLNLDFQSVFEVAGKVTLSLDPKDRRQGSTERPSLLLERELEKIAVSIEALKKLPSQHVRAYAGFGQFFKLLDGETCSELPQSDPVFWTLRWTPECVKERCQVSAFSNKWEIMMVSHDKIMFRNKKKLKGTEIKRKEGQHFVDKVAQHLNQVTLDVKLAPYIGKGETRKFMVRKVGSGAGVGILGAAVGLTIYIAVATLVSAATMGIALPIAAGG
ncbi:hypothetical protein R1flu_005113 [Riccia fluitans]|uniref:Protein kinase domain-containing protein n=1 Tax=Riccia fluitans TaxID=41844 RepID=A0ABD1YS84_9MARC